MASKEGLATVGLHDTAHEVAAPRPALSSQEALRFALLETVRMALGEDEGVEAPVVVAQAAHPTSSLDHGPWPVQASHAALQTQPGLIEHHSRASSDATSSDSYAPAPTRRRPPPPKGGVPGGPCAHCGATDSPQWRRPLTKKVVLCNACGIYYSRHHSLPKRKKAMNKPLVSAELVKAEHEGTHESVRPHMLPRGMPPLHGAATKASSGEHSGGQLHHHHYHHHHHDSDSADAQTCIAAGETSCADGLPPMQQPPWLSSLPSASAAAAVTAGRIGSYEADMRHPVTSEPMRCHSPTESSSSLMACARGEGAAMHSGSPSTPKRRSTVGGEPAAKIEGGGAANGDGGPALRMTDDDLECSLARRALKRVAVAEGGMQKPASGSMNGGVNGGMQRPVSGSMNGGMHRPVSGSMNGGVSGGMQRPVSGSMTWGGGGADGVRAGGAAASWAALCAPSAGSGMLGGAHAASRLRAVTGCGNNNGVQAAAAPEEGLRPRAPGSALGSSGRMPDAKPVLPPSSNLMASMLQQQAHQAAASANASALRMALGGAPRSPQQQLHHSSSAPSGTLSAMAAARTAGLMSTQMALHNHT